MITVIAMPIMMMLLFVYVFGGAMNTCDVSYINYIVLGKDKTTLAAVLWCLAILGIFCASAMRVYKRRKK
jgi:hypothetical protein